MNRIVVVKKIFMQALPIILFLPALVWVGLLLFVPLMAMIYDSVWDGCLTLGAYTQFFDFLYIRVLLRSLFLATTSAFIALSIGYPVAYFLANSQYKGKNILIFLLTLPFWTNLIIQVYAWFFILERTGLLNKLLIHLGIINEPIQFAYNMGAIILVMVYCYLPFMIMPIYTILQKIDPYLMEASMDLGATRWQTFCRITWPLSLSGVRTGFLLVLVPAFGEFVIPALVGGGRYLTVGSLISYYFLTSQDAASGAAFTVISGLVLLSIVGIIHMVLQVKRNK